MYPHIFGSCSHELTQKTPHELTVHHRDHNHGNNPADDSYSQLLCLYCPDNGHDRQLEAHQRDTYNDDGKSDAATFNRFADLKSMPDSNK